MDEGQYSTKRVHKIVIIDSSSFVMFVFNKLKSFILVDECNVHECNVQMLLDKFLSTVYWDT